MKSANYWRLRWGKLANYSLKVLVADPGAFSIETPFANWVILGLDPVQKEDLRALLGTSDAGTEQVCRGLADATVIKIANGTDSLNSVTIWRGLASPYAVYYSVRKNGEVIIADHFRNLLTRLPLDERITTDETVVDHCLFRTSPGHGTYCTNVNRVGFGECREISLSSGDVQISRHGKIGSSSPLRSVEDYIDDIDAALEAATTGLRTDPNTSALFSGGVDSTLVQSYLSPDTPAVYVTRNGRGLAYEQDYAPDAARKLGIDLVEVSYDECNYLEDLAATTLDIGMPPHLLQWPFFRAGVMRSKDKVVVGVFGDALFGVSAKTAQLASLFTSGPGSAALELARPALAITSRLSSLAPAAAELRRDIHDPYGYAGQSTVNGDLNMVHQAFGEETVRRRLETRLSYVIDRAPKPNPKDSNLARHLELGHWTEYYGDDVPLQFHMLGLAHGKNIVSPFQTSTLMACAADIPPSQRFVKKLNCKYLLKRLLKKRVPGYPVNQRKGASLFSLEALHRDTTLAEIWERYQIPAWCEGELKPRLSNIRDGVTRNAITWAVWEKEVLRNPDLTLIQGTREFS